MLNQFFANDNVPEVGMDATELYVTDRYATKIVAVPNPTTIETWDGKRVVGNVWDAEKEEMVFDDTPLISVWTKRKNGKWVAKGQPMKDGTALLVGVNAPYRDPSF